MLDLATWESYQDGERGLIAEQTSRSYYADVSSIGSWQLWTYAADNAVTILDSGHSKTLAEGKRRAMQAAVARVQELAAYMAEQEMAPNSSPAVTYALPEQSKFAQLVRLYLTAGLAVACALLVLLLGLYLAPLRTLAAVGIVAGIVAIVHAVIVAATREAAMVEKLCSSTRQKYTQGKLDTVGTQRPATMTNAERQALQLAMQALENSRLAKHTRR